MVPFQGPMLNFENVQKIGTRKQHNSQLQQTLSLTLPASNTLFVWNAFVFLFPCADHLVALLPKKWWCFSWPMEIHDALRAAWRSHSWERFLPRSSASSAKKRVAKGSLLKSWDSTERYLRCIYGPSKGWTVWLENNKVINQNLNKMFLLFFPGWDTNQKFVFRVFVPLLLVSGGPDSVQTLAECFR